MQIQISWLLEKPTDLDLHCLQKHGISGSARLGLEAILPDLFLCKVGQVTYKDLIAYIHLKYDFALKQDLLQKKRIYSPFHKGLGVYEAKQEVTKAAPLLQND